MGKLRRETLMIANGLSATFMPAEKAQFEATRKLTESLSVAVRASHDRQLGGPAGADARAAALIALAQSTAASVEAQERLREAHRQFAVFASEVGLFAESWGCPDPECSVPGFTDTLTQAAAAA